MNRTAEHFKETLRPIASSLAVMLLLVLGLGIPGVGAQSIRHQPATGETHAPGDTLTKEDWESPGAHFVSGGEGGEIFYNNDGILQPLSLGAQGMVLGSDGGKPVWGPLPLPALPADPAFHSITVTHGAEFSTQGGTTPVRIDGVPVARSDAVSSLTAALAALPRHTLDSPDGQITGVVSVDNSGSTTLSGNLLLGTGTLQLRHGGSPALVLSPFGITLDGVSYTLRTDWDSLAEIEAATGHDFSNADSLDTGLVADARIPDGLTRDSEWDSLGEIEAATGHDFSSASNLDTGSLGDGLLPAGVTRDSEWDSLSKIEAVIGHDFSSASNLDTGIVPDARIADGITRDTEWNSLGKIEAVTGHDFSDASNLDAGTVPEPRLPYRMNQNVRTTDYTQFEGLGLGCAPGTYRLKVEGTGDIKLGNGLSNVTINGLTTAIEDRLLVNGAADTGEDLIINGEFRATGGGTSSIVGRLAVDGIATFGSTTAVKRTESVDLSVQTFSTDDAKQPTLSLVKSGSGAEGSFTTPTSDGESLGELSFSGVAYGMVPRKAVRIEAVHDGLNYYPWLNGALNIYTASSSATPSLSVNGAGSVKAHYVYNVDVSGTSERQLWIFIDGEIGYDSSARFVDGLPNKVNEREFAEYEAVSLIDRIPIKIYDRAHGKRDNEIGAIAEDADLAGLAERLPGFISFGRDEITTETFVGYEYYSSGTLVQESDFEALAYEGYGLELNPSSAGTLSPVDIQTWVADHLTSAPVVHVEQGFVQNNTPQTINWNRLIPVNTRALQAHNSDIRWMARELMDARLENLDLRLKLEDLTARVDALENTP